MFSDRFANCARPEIQEDIVVRGMKVRVQKEWKDYTDREKGLAVNYKFTCGAEIFELLLYVEREVEILKAQVTALGTIKTAIPPELNENFAKIDAAIGEVKTELEGRATPEYVGRLESALHDQLDRHVDSLTATLASFKEAMIEFDMRLSAIEKKFAQIDATIEKL